MPPKKALTSYRQSILDFIERSAHPLSAKEIWAKLKNQPDFSTIYRALNFLVKENTVKSVHFADGPQFYYSASKKHRHFVYCTFCQKARGFQRCNAHELSLAVEKETGYKLTGHQLYFTGCCPDCQHENNNPSSIQGVSL